MTGGLCFESTPPFLQFDPEPAGLFFVTGMMAYVMGLLLNGGEVGGQITLLHGPKDSLSVPGFFASPSCEVI
jgi:hypothetical protein